MTKGEIYRMEREKGLTYREIGEKYGVSKQAVAQFCGKYQPARFMPYDENACRYVNLRNWLNKEKLTRSELLRRLGLEACKNNYRRLWAILSGRLE